VTSLEELLAEARAAARLAYVPHSHFHVGAALSAAGQTYTGCNVENASYGLTICAERNAIFHAVAQGVRKIDAIAVACVDAAPGDQPGLRMPCGACRQVIAEFAGPDTPVIVDGVGTFRLQELVPNPFELPK
jgi:cytidine deaminase